MGYLEGLKVVTAAKPANISPIFHKRSRLIEKLQSQIECIKAKSEGREHFITFMKTYKGENGENLQSQQVRKVRPWWYRSTEGRIVMEIRYSNKRLELAKGKTGIEVDNINALVPAVEILIKAIEDGELHNSINSISTNFRASLTK